jgi:hypothetical protein
MPKLPKYKIPLVKLDPAGHYVELSLTDDQRRGLFEAPGSTVVAIVELTSMSYTGHADDVDKDPTVKVRVSGCEVAHSDEEAEALMEARRAMYRRRKINGTLDEVGPGPQDPAEILAQATLHYPTEGEFEEHKARQRSGTGGGRP